MRTANSQTERNVIMPACHFNVLDEMERLLVDCVGLNKNDSQSQSSARKLVIVTNVIKHATANKTSVTERMSRKLH